MSFVSFIQ